MSAAATVPVSVRPSRPNGWWGMLLFVAAEATLVSAIVGSYLYLRVNTRVWPPSGTPEPSLLLPVALTVVLVASVVPFHLSLRSARADSRGFCLALLALAAGLQALSFGLSLHAFQDDLARFTPQESAYASIYFVLLGAGIVHVAGGLLLDAWLLVRVGVRLTVYRVNAIWAASLYWYVVAAITVVIALTSLSPRL